MTVSDSKSGLPFECQGGLHHKNNTAGVGERSTGSASWSGKVASGMHPHQYKTSPVRQARLGQSSVTLLLPFYPCAL